MHGAHHGGSKSLRFGKDHAKSFTVAILSTDAGATKDPRLGHSVQNNGGRLRAKETSAHAETSSELFQAGAEGAISNNFQVHFRGANFRQRLYQVGAALLLNQPSDEHDQFLIASARRRRIERGRVHPCVVNGQL